MHRVFRLVSGFTLFLLLISVHGASAQSDPVVVQQQLLDAIARGDIATALGLFTDDAVIDAPSGSCLATPCVGKAAIQKDLERLMTDKSRHVTPLSSYSAGNVLVTRLEASNATIRAAGIERLIVWVIREMRGDKIAVVRCCLPERTDPQTARFLEWERTHRPNPD
jgi:hypothetical protein